MGGQQNNVQCCLSESACFTEIIQTNRDVMERNYKQIVESYTHRPRVIKRRRNADIANLVPGLSLERVQ